MPYGVLHGTLRQKILFIMSKQLNVKGEEVLITPFNSILYINRNLETRKRRILQVAYSKIKNREYSKIKNGRPCNGHVWHTPRLRIESTPRLRIESL
jgi:hypothetical protein